VAILVESPLSRLLLVVTTAVDFTKMVLMLPVSPSQLLSLFSSFSEMELSSSLLRFLLPLLLLVLMEQALLIELLLPFFSF